MSVPFYEYRTDLLDVLSSDRLEYPPHLHDCPELVRVRSGQLKVALNGQDYLVSSGKIIIIFPHVIHSYQTVIYDSESRFDRIICGMDPDNGFPRYLKSTSLANPLHTLAALHPDVDYIFSALLLEAVYPQNTQIINAYFQLLWQRLLPVLSVTSPLQPAQPDLTTNLILYINDHFCEPLSLDHLSKTFGVCRFYLSHIFSQVLGMGFCEYVNTLRVNHAKELLSDTREGILDIAIQCGFQSQQTFNRVFKKISGMTPSQYRAIQEDVSVYP